MCALCPYLASSARRHSSRVFASLKHMNPGCMMLSSVGLAALLIGTWGLIDHSVWSNGKVSLEFAGARSVSRSGKLRPNRRCRLWYTIMLHGR